ncbi:hypothetical protein TYRP_000042 [Tyrophagus putrescentiae]|nr:hypothetical protein TYRP_000042 [Tyrophagus putrescentiae]
MAQHINSALNYPAPYASFDHLVAVYGTGFLVAVFENGSSKNVTWHPIDDHLLAKDDDEWRFSAVQRQKLAEEYTGAETKNPTTKEAGNSGRTQEPRKR